MIDKKQREAILERLNLWANDSILIKDYEHYIEKLLIDVCRLLNALDEMEKALENTLIIKKSVGVGDCTIHGTNEYIGAAYGCGADVGKAKDGKNE